MNTTAILESDHSGLAQALAFAALLMISSPAFRSVAEDLGGLATPETIVGSEIAADEASPDMILDDVLEAIANAGSTAEKVQMLFSVNDFRIIFLGDAQASDNAGEIQAALDQNADAIASLRSAIEGSSVFYIALDSRDVDPGSVVAASIADDKSVTAYVFGERR